MNYNSGGGGVPPSLLVVDDYNRHVSQEGSATTMNGSHMQNHPPILRKQRSQVRHSETQQ